MGLLEGYGLQKAALARGLIPANSIILNDVFGTRECDTMAQYGADRLEVARTPVWLAWRNAHALAQALASDDLLEVDQRQFKGALGGAL